MKLMKLLGGFLTRRGWWCGLLAIGLASNAAAQQIRTFTLNDAEITLEQADADVSVYFRSMRLNRALNVWNVEVAVTNTSARVLTGPLVLSIESFSGTTGPINPDGLQGSQPARAFYDLSGETSDGMLAPGEGTAPRTLTLGRDGNGSPAVATSFFVAPPPPALSLAITRSLDDAGLPLTSVAMSITGPSGAGNQMTDSRSGVASFGQGPGEHVVKFSADGYLPVWRMESLGESFTTVLPNPRLTKRNPVPVTLSPLSGATLRNDNGTIEIQIAAGAVGQESSATLTPLSGQSLPAFLPLGWSPLSAFWLESSTPLSGMPTALLKPSTRIAPSETAALVKWDESTLRWVVTQTLAGNDTNAVNVALSGVGAYGLVVADLGELAPPPAQTGAALPPSTIALPSVSGLSATGDVTPPASPASTVPELVTGRAEVVLRHADAPLPSGYLLRGEVTETYLLADGSLRLTPQYEHFIVGYQRPGDNDPNSLHARFPMRPVLLFGSDQLDQATVRVDVLPQAPFDGRVLDETGGQIATDQIRVLAGAGRISAPSALRLRRVDASIFTNVVATGQTVIGAFDLTVDETTLSGSLALQLSGAPANARLVLARVLGETGFYGLQPVERLQSDGAGNLVSLEPAVGERLPGLRGSGQFVLVEVTEPQELVGGVARDGTGALRSGMPVSLFGLPWLTLTDDEGRFQLVAPAGEQRINLLDPTNGDAGFVEVTVEPGGAPEQDLSTAPSGPLVARITPADNAIRVPRVTSVVIEFNESVNPGTVIGAIELLAPNDGVIPTSLSLNLANRVATLSPATELEAGTEYRVRLAATIADPEGLPLEGPNEFTFTTVPLSTRDTAAQLVIFEPGATNVPVEILDDIPAYEAGDDPFAIVVHGNPGVADPEVPVVLVNESTGETATVLSKVDGSFSSVISGTEEDFVSATFVNLNGTRVYVPVSRQEFDDGFVGLYPQGGILEAQSDGGPVRVIIEPAAIKSKSKLRLTTIGLAQLVTEELGGVQPDGAKLAAGAMVLETDGEPPEGEVTVRFSVDLLAAGYPSDADPFDAAIALARVTDEQDVKAFEVLDQLIFTPNENAEFAPRPRLNDGEQLFFGFVEKTIGSLPYAGNATKVFKYVMVPLLVGGKPVVVKGRTYVAPEVFQIQNPLSRASSVPGSVGTAAGKLGGIIDLGNSVLSETSDAVFGRPLSGAFISLQNIETPGRPGRLRSGMVYSTSDSEGRFLMVAPSSPQILITPTDAFVLEATHPNFKDKVPQNFFALQDISIAGVAFKNFVFRQPLPFNSPPTVNVAHSPVDPAPGEEVEIQVNAAQGFSIPPTVNVFVSRILPTNLPPSAAEIIVDNPAEVLANNRTRWTGRLQTDEAVREVVLRVSAISGNGTVHPALFYPISFRGKPTPSEGPIVPSDPTEELGPIVVGSNPPGYGFVDEFGRLQFNFNEPIDRLVEEDVTGIVLNGEGAPLRPVVRLSDDQTTLTVQYAGLTAGEEYSLTLSGTSIRDLNGNPLDQRPGTDGADAFNLVFRTAPVRNIEIPGVAQPVASVLLGSRMYVLDSTDPPTLKTFDVSIPTEPKLLGSTRVGGQPRDLCVIPKFQYKKDPQDPVHTGDLVAVVGGELGSVVDDLLTIIVPDKYLRIFDMSDPANAVQLVSASVSFRDAAAVTKVRWHPPHLVYQEYGADIQQLAFVNLQEMIWGFNATRVRIDSFPVDGRPGVDVNGDGDYVDEGDLIPVPPRRPAEFFGKKQSLVVSGTTQKILDFSVTGGTVGVTLSGGVQLTPGGQPTSTAVRPQYRTLLFNNQTVNSFDSSVEFELGNYPGRVSVFEGLQLEIEGELKTPVIALVSLSPDIAGENRLLVIDITFPEEPQLLNNILIPAEVTGGVLQSVVRRPDGLLELATSQHVLLLEPSLLAAASPPEGPMHPSIIGFVPDAGGRSKSLGTSLIGLHSSAGFGRTDLIQTAPSLSFVHFPANEELVNPLELPSADMEIAEALNNLRRADGLIPAKARNERDQVSQLFPIDPEVHYHVMVRAPGGAGETIKVGLESISSAGWSLPNKGAGFPPVRAVDEATLEALEITLRPECDAPIRPLIAHRLSDDPRSEYYNVYLSRPLVVIYESVSFEQLASFQAFADREILWSAAGMRAFIEPTELENPVLGPFAAVVDIGRKEIQPIAAVTVPTLDVSYVMGPNPPPAGGGVVLPGTHGAISAHSGEFRTEALDISLPSPRMPIAIQRQIGGQDGYEGPFGLGWDFNYNQRITELQPNLFPEGFKMPLIPRATVPESVIGSSKDLLFHTGRGRIVLFRRVSDEMPPEYADDPLVADLDYSSKVADYYLPEPGVFDLLVKFKDGRFERLTPGGMRYKYSVNGRLETITDRFPENQHVLGYDRRGWLVRIDDRSVDTPRFVEFGYYRRAADSDFTGELDEQTENAFLVGKICRIRDYAGRDVLYFYNDEGLLTRRESFEVAGENGGFSGRNQTHYTYEDCRITGVLVTKDGVPLVVSETVESDRGAKVADATAGFSGASDVTIPPNNAAELLPGQVSSVTQADGRTTDYRFNSLGHVDSIQISGPNSAPATLVPAYNEHGQPVALLYPEGRSHTMTYDSANPIYRSRGNLLALEVDPGTRGGDAYTETYGFDPRYNLPVGGQTSANGFTITYFLSSDGRYVNSIRHGNAGTETIELNDHGQLTRHVDPDGVETTHTYNAATGFVATSRKGDNSTTYGYGGAAGSLGKPSSVQPPRGAAINYSYNANLQEVQVVRDISVQRLAYDEQGHRIYHQEVLGDGTARETREDYEVNGFITRRSIGGIEVDGEETTLEYRYKPDALFRVEEILHPGGTVQKYEYNGLGYLTKMSLESYVEEYTPDLHGNVLEVKKGGDLVQTTDYDGLDRPKTSTILTGDAEHVTVQTHFPGGELKSKTLTDPNFGVLQDQVINQIDALGRVLGSTINGDTVTRNDTFVHGVLERSSTGPRQTVRETWDTAGFPTGYSDAILSTAYITDGNGNVERATRTEDGATYADIFTYDDLDHRETAADSFGEVATFTARADGRNLEVMNARGNTTVMTYSALGEVLTRRRADGMEFRFRHDEQRQKKFTGDTGDGFDFDYDNLFRMTKSTLRNGAESTYEGFDARNKPRSITIPGGSITATYDLQERTTSSVVEFGSTTYETATDYDALNRVRVVTYEQDGGGENQAHYTYDKAGPLLSAEYQEDNAEFTVGFAYRNDLTRRSITYPSGFVVEEDRDEAGRLLGISNPLGNIVTITDWQGNSQPKSVDFGGVLRMDNLFDTRGRLTGSRYVRTPGGALQAEMRYQYDAANNVEMRQFLHRAGKTDNFSYDTGERVVRAQIGGIPLDGDSDVARFAYQRSYNYDATGLDFLVTAPVVGPGGTPPPFAASWSAHDAFLLPGTVNGTGRGSADALGRVTEAVFQARSGAGDGALPVGATLEHNGNGHLIRIERVDGLTVENRFQPGGLRYARIVRQGAAVLEHRHFVYDDQARLLEEYDRTTAEPTLIARYFYLASDAPCAADLADETGQLWRHYYIRDDVHSVVAVADRFGIVEERVWYDTHGQPTIEPRDNENPVVKRVIGGPGGTLYIEMSEPVTDIVFDLGPGPGIRRLNQSYSAIVDSPAGTTTLPEVVGGFEPYTVVVFTPEEPLSGDTTITMSPGKLTDDWGNHMEEHGVVANVTGVEGVVYYDAGPGVDTDGGTVARSTVGSPFLFHGQYFDYDTGLIYLRARFYDPFTGMFLEPDPLGYEDSVNLYTGIGNNPVSLRDPDGLETQDWLTSAAKQISDRVKREWNQLANLRADAIAAEKKAKVPDIRDGGYEHNPEIIRETFWALAHEEKRIGGYAKMKKAFGDVDITEHALFGDSAMESYEAPLPWNMAPHEQVSYEGGRFLPYRNHNVFIKGLGKTDLRWFIHGYLSDDVDFSKKYYIGQAYNVKEVARSVWKNGTFYSENADINMKSLMDGQYYKDSGYSLTDIAELLAGPAPLDDSYRTSSATPYSLSEQMRLKKIERARSHAK